MKNRRSLASTLFSPISMKSLRYANYAAMGLVLVFAVLMAALLSQLQVILEGAAGGDLGGEFVITALARMKYLIPFTLVGVAVFVLLGESARTRQLDGEVIAIMAQISALREGNYAHKRLMRKHDQLKPMMEALHDLADGLAQSDRG